ncbi:hypothetical protein [Spirochaeta africana]|uniref:Uncharacterized protein n=1 Tax=Spirochaeta africana (strain ATCC 700263 / DSM 8902 / Z-7692) TaxID=889378 RepID=H9UIY9_SPIAZ|nr:hypothetical protein [Spirochaeta africana]AFG37482.1 hypothetical protein Spiaf_1419 [Spirochaeta africana DSM 8902]
MSDFITIERDQGSFLAIRTGMQSGAKGIQKMYQDGLPQGYVVIGDRVQVWKARGWQTIDGEVYLYGDHYTGMPLGAVLSQPPQQALQAIARLQSALTTAENSNLSLPPLSFRSVLLLDDGGVLFVPQRVADTIHSYLSPEAALHEVEVLSHPECSTRQTRSGFAVLSLIYHLICSEAPFPAESSLERTNLLSYYDVLPPQLYQPDLDDELSAAISQGLVKPAERMPDNAALQGIIERLIELHAEGRLQFPPRPKPELADERRKRLQKHRIKAGLERYKVHWMLAIGIAVLIGMLFTTRLTDSSETPDYATWSPQQVIEGYYAGFNSLDHLEMDELTVGRTASREIREVMQMYLNNSIQLGYTFRPGVITPEEFLAESAPPLGETQTIYGISDLTVTELFVDEQQAEFEAVFEKWGPYLGGDPQDAFDDQRGPEVERIRRQDRITLENTRSGWKIAEIDTLEIEQLEILELRDHQVRDQS